ncbi:MAG: ATP-binding protein [Armatimonadetes bacterium]|nr:ATP-binding protein [Armatimonadota bacterium]
MADTWIKRIRVDKDIVTLLSRRTYDNFPQAIREVVSNAYDADSTLVDILIDRGSDRISIIDNGCGMTPDDFDYYLRIAAMTREARLTGRLGRRRIGHFGIGFLSMFPFCRAIEITSTTENSDVVFSAGINAEAYTSPSSRSADVGDIEVRGTQRRDPSLRRTHGTTFVLSGLTDLVTQYFEVRPEASRKSIQSWDWQQRLRKPMEVRMNRAKLYRNDICRAEILESSAEPVVLDEHGIRFVYAIMTPWTTISPVEARGLQLRLKNVGVGNPTYFGLNVIGRVYGKLVWLGGEVHILDGLDEDMSIDRNTFTWSPRYEAVSNYFLDRLRSLAERLDVEHSAMRDIEDFVDGDMRRAPAVSVREAIESRIKKLRELEYQVVEMPGAPTGSARPVEVDTGNRLVRYFINHPELLDTITVAGRVFEVEFGDWDYRSSETPACKLQGNKVIFNGGYPPFRDHRRKTFCQELCVLLEIGKLECADKTELSRFVLSRFAEETDYE